MNSHSSAVTMTSRCQWLKRLSSSIIILLCLSIGIKLQRIALDGDRSIHSSRRLVETSNSQKSRNKILYIITTLTEYNSGTRNTVKGSDRLQLTLIPVMAESVRSMMAAGYQVDVYLLAHFTLSPERQALVQQALPEGVGLEVWNDASPVGYDFAKPLDDPRNRLHDHTIHLARQHRFVIKDKFLNYDLFVCFEDDMIIHGAHVEHFEKVTNELHRLAQAAPTELSSYEPDPLKNFYGNMTKGQLERMIPGFIRVEVLLDEKNYPAQSETGPVPVDLDFNETQSTLNPAICCHVDPQVVSSHMPPTPTADQLILWETNTMALGIRQMPADSWLKWVIMQRGPVQKDFMLNRKIGDYWSNRNNDYWPGQRRPAPGEFNFINNQGGWMATKRQLFHWHTKECQGSFLPPFDDPHFRFDGLDMRNVEWYSGGMQLSTVRHACNMQRIILIDPDGFSKSLLYHSANNKQRQLAWKREKSFQKANTLLWHMNHLQKRAANEIQ